MTVKLLTEQHLGFLSSKGGYTGSSESTQVKMSHCWKSLVTAHMINIPREIKVKLPQIDIKGTILYMSPRHFGFLCANCFQTAAADFSICSWESVKVIEWGRGGGGGALTFSSYIGYNYF